MKFKHVPEQMTEAHIIALTDAWPPTLLQMYKQPAPASRHVVVHRICRRACNCP